MSQVLHDVRLSKIFYQDIIGSYLDELLDNKLISVEHLHFENFSIKDFDFICNWIANQSGEANLRLLGRKVGNSIYMTMLSSGMITMYSSITEVVSTYCNWYKEVFMEEYPCSSCTIRREEENMVQIQMEKSLNPFLSMGILDSLIRKCGVTLPEIKLSRAPGTGFDQYQISWIN